MSVLLLDDPVLHVGDRIRIVCLEAPELCVARSVGPDGTVDVPRIGAIPAASKKAGELSKRIASYLPGGLLPAIVEIRFIGGPIGQVSIVGAVKRPLRLFAPRGVSSDRLLLAAEPLPEADRALLPRLIRFGSGTTINLPVVSVERRISVLGAVVQPQAFGPSDSLSLAQAIESAGGLGGHGDPNNIIVVRGSESIPASLPSDVNFRLFPGDVVRVGLISERKFVVVKGLVEKPGSVEYAPGMTATKAITAAGGLLTKAKNGTLIWQTGAKIYRLSIAFIFDRRIPDPILGANDTIIIEETRP